jgi:uncharacterized membrane protein YjfL (UPF0719 family)
MKESSFKKQARFVFYFGAAIIFIIGVVMTLTQMTANGWSQSRFGNPSVELAVSGPVVIGISLFIVVLGKFCFR